MNKISPTKALFIKLGQGGAYEEECIEKRNILKIGYSGIRHDLCMSGHQWDEVYQQLLNENNGQRGVATYHLNQIKYFYEEDEDTLWITFYQNKLWWCLADEKIEVEQDGTKYRHIKGKWNDANIKGNVLFLEDISGRLLRTQGFRATICRVAEFDYLVDKINNDEPKDIKDAEEAFNNLREKLVFVIKKLQPQDFEILIDLIFRNAGWQRLSVVGHTQHTIDLAIGHPITGERAVVQIKCQSNLSEYKRYEKKFTGMTEYSRFFYITHTPEPSLKNYKNESENISIYFADKVAEFAINSGLYGWILKIAG